MSIDPEKLKKSHETLKSTPVKPLRSKLAPAADVVMDLHAKGYPLREIATWLAEHLDLRVSVSTLHAFLISVQKQKARQSEVERRSLGSTHLSSASTAPALAQETLLPTRKTSSRDEAQAAIRALKNFAQTGDAKAEQPAFYFDPTEPLIGNPTRKTTK